MFLIFGEGRRQKGRRQKAEGRHLPASLLPFSPSSKGFTLMELLVVLGIVSTVVVSSTDIFMLVSRSQRKIFSLERAQADARYTMETIAREVRNGKFDYAYYSGGPVPTPTDDLALIDNAGAPIRFHESVAADESACPDAASTPCLLVTLGTDSPASLTPKGVALRNLKFYVSPGIDPFLFDPLNGTYAASGQPRVTIVLVLESAGNRANEQGSIVYSQTTVTSRAYRR
jgi:prepilin-type N-terminal cleavage/methylation domain-containing protein